MEFKPSAKKLILGLLLATEGRALTVAEAITACALFDISENNVRVTLARLSADDMITSPERGCYQLGPKASGVARQVATWHEAEQNLTAWQGDYVLVLTGMLGRSDRSALSQRQRAMSFLGLRELERGVYVRPDNLSGGVAAVRARLLGLGLPKSIIVCRSGTFDSTRETQITGLWDITALNNLYKERRTVLERWLQNQHRLDLSTAARESYLLGGQAIRQLVFDPWLPQEMIDADARHAFACTVQRFDEAGKVIWARFLPQQTGEGEMSLSAGVPAQAFLQEEYGVVV